MKNLATFFFVLALAAEAAQLTLPDQPPGGSSPRFGFYDHGLFFTPANQILAPAGYQVEIPAIRPRALALSPDRQLLVTAGNTHQLLVMAAASGKILQSVPLPADRTPEAPPVAAGILNPDPLAQLSFDGLAFSPDGSRLYFANVNGDLKVFTVDNQHQVSPSFSIPLPPARAPGRKAEIPAGIAVSPDGRKIYVAFNLSNQLAELDAVTGRILRTWNVGVAPLGVALAGRKAYVSNWGGRRPQPGDDASPAGRGTMARVDSRSIAAEGSVSVISLEATNYEEIVTGRHACALALSPDQKYLAVANAASDTISIIATHTDRVIETICARVEPGDPFGAQPNALAFNSNGDRLFVCNGTQNAVAQFKFKPGASKLLGLIPVGWFPDAIICNARASRLLVANLKSLGGLSPKLPGVRDYCTLSFVPLPSAKKLAGFTQQALDNLRYARLAQAKLPPRPDQLPCPVPERVGEPSVFQHVIYVIKENRTYDQILGDVKAGNGDAAICNFGRRVTPNEHQLVTDFVLLDNTYCSGLVSADGHQWTDTAIATDYIERSFGPWPRSYPAGGMGLFNQDALAFSSAGFIWNDALEHGRTFRDYGEYASSQVHWAGPAPGGGPDWAAIYQDFIKGTHLVVPGCEPDVESLRPYLDTHAVGWDLRVPDIIRAAEFSRELKQFEQSGTFPNLVIVWLPNDHTSGAEYGEPTPEAQVADNDLALGQIVEAVSHSRFWTNTCLFAVEDDPQAGWDHVSGFRTTAYLVSPFTRRHATVSTQYNQTSLLRTMELILGLPPMNQMDATADPMFDCFTNTPDFTAYNVVTNRVPLDDEPAPCQNL
jgi:YVTN family beta-propeller protein